MARTHVAIAVDSIERLATRTWSGFRAVLKFVGYGKAGFDGAVHCRDGSRTSLKLRGLEQKLNDRPVAVVAFSDDRHRLLFGLAVDFLNRHERVARPLSRRVDGIQKQNSEE